MKKGSKNVWLGSLCMVFWLVGCSSDMKKTEVPEVQGTPPLEMPPGLVLPKTVHDMDVPPEQANEASEPSRNH